MATIKDVARLAGVSVAWAYSLRPVKDRHPFSLSYGVILPSSLTIVLSLALGYSPHPPVSVYGTGAFNLDRDFSRQCEISYFAT